MLFGATGLHTPLPQVPPLWNLERERGGRRGKGRREGEREPQVFTFLACDSTRYCTCMCQMTKGGQLPILTPTSRLYRLAFHFSFIVDNDTCIVWVGDRLHVD